jgi:hypothetical protein
VIVLNIASSSSVTVDSGLFHCMASWNLATATAHMYINGADVLSSTTLTNTNIDYAQSSPNIYLGRNSTGANYLNACLGGLYTSRTYIDLSVSGNRAKFYNSDNVGNSPPGSVDLGTDGSIPESAAPIVYLNNGLADGTNAGGGGNFTVSGSFNAC